MVYMANVRVCQGPIESPGLPTRDGGDFGNVGPRWETDPIFGRGPKAAIMLLQSFSHVAGSDANDGIISRVIRSRPTKQFHADDAFFQRIEVACDRLIDDVLEKLTAAVAPLEYIAFNHFLQVVL